MRQSKIILILLASMLITATAYCQEKSEGHQIKKITGTVTSVDAVGNIISIRTQDQQPMAFSVPDKANITQDTRGIGLMDIQKSDSVTIQYYVASSKNIISGIADNESVVNE